MASGPLDGVSYHMRKLGLAALAHANWHSAFMSFENPHWTELSVLQAAHAAEILIKARIAEEHPLLIFEQLPKQSGASSQHLAMEQLLEGGRTYQFNELPDRLWATTGLRIPALEKFRSFGRLRNQIQHFTYPDRSDLSGDVLDFVFSVIDPFINECWGLFAVDYCEDSEPYTYFVDALVRRKISFSVSPGLADNWADVDLEWPKGSKAYRKQVEARVALALQSNESGV